MSTVLVGMPAPLIAPGYAAFPRRNTLKILKDRDLLCDSLLKNELTGLLPALPRFSAGGHLCLSSTISSDAYLRSATGDEPDRRQRRQNSRLSGETFATRVFVASFPQYADVFGGVTVIRSALDP
jgi:hypothetical protein